MQLKIIYTWAVICRLEKYLQPSRKMPDCLKSITAMRGPTLTGEVDWWWEGEIFPTWALKSLSRPIPSPFSYKVGRGGSNLFTKNIFKQNQGQPLARKQKNGDWAFEHNSPLRRDKKCIKNGGGLHLQGRCFFALSWLESMLVSFRFLEAVKWEAFKRDGGLAEDFLVKWFKKISWTLTD